LGVSIIFVTDRHIRWYNYPETEAVLQRVTELAAKYPSVGVLGESMGGSGAILFTKFARNVDRVLAISPQYSVTPPFVRFDGRYDYIGEKISPFYYHTFCDSPSPEKCILLYGNKSWHDYLHVSMFAAAGFRVGFVEDAPHEVSLHLKRLSPERNCLHALLKWFSDFDSPFSITGLHSIQGIKWSSVPLKEGSRYSDFITRGVKFDLRVRDKVELLPSEFTLISSGKIATQSSLSEYSIGKTAEQDATRALDGVPTSRYKFHTATEQNPWWSVDLGGRHVVREVRLFNRLDHVDIAARASRFDILMSDDGKNYVQIHRKDDGAIFGGADGRPYTFLPTPGVVTRFVMIRLLGKNCLHLDQVQVFGQQCVNS
jgi:hypothetical protein